MKTILALILMVLATVIISNAQPNGRGGMAIRMADDVHSYANPQQAKVTHVDLDWTVLFDQKIIKGSATLSFQRPPDAVNAPLILDTRDLNIEKIETSTGG
ncbi:MAG TPA: hypothetical protein PKY82_34275, partial [Pyrinomonadaceae bacterium]|nr:hypothetical protein [Pyrinomonadaceae bacterium]